MSPTDIAWFAGFFDGEGCVQVARAGRGDRVHVLRVSVTQVARAPIDRLAAAFGGLVYPKPSRRPRDRHQWGWETRSWAAVRFLDALLPYLTVKRQEAELAIQYQRSKTTKRGVLSSPFEIAEQASFREALIEAHHFEEGGDANE